jgi:hypothetical protein
MCTIVIKEFRNIKAVEIPQDINKLHDPQRLNVLRCQQVILSLTQMSKLATTYASTMPNWMTREFFQPESERNRISVHEYCKSASIRTMRRMDDLELVDFFEQQLKSKDNFASAFEHVLKTKLKAYMKKYVLIQPGDWPCQFFSRQLVYETIANLLPSMLTPQTLGNNDDLTTTDNIHPTPRAVNHDSARICTSSSTTTRVLPPLAAAIPMIGPLHISINSREHVLLSFHPFFKRVYEHLFPHKT